MSPTVCDECSGLVSVSTGVDPAFTETMHRFDCGTCGWRSEWLPHKQAVYGESVSALIDRAAAGAAGRATEPEGTQK